MILVVSATFLGIFPAISLWLGSCFRDLSIFSYFFRGIERSRHPHLDDERHYNKETGHFVYGEPNLPVIREELDLCGYFAIISSEKMEAKDAIGLYKNRDASEKVFRADKSYLGNNCLRGASEESASTKIFIGFIALIIRCKI